MASTGTPTQSIGLNQWLGSDKPERVDFNSDNLKIDNGINSILNPNAALNREINDIPIENLQSVIDSLPRLLPENITINVLPGTVETDLVIRGFSGPCSLNILGAGSPGQTTHTLNSIICERVSISTLGIAGFNTVTDGTCVSISLCNSGRINITHLNAVTTGATGVFCSVAKDTVLIHNSTVSNKTTAYMASETTMRIVGVLGTNNGTMYRANASSRMHVETGVAHRVMANQNLFNVDQSSILLFNDSVIRRGIGGVGGNGIQGTTTLTVPLADLRNTIRALPRYLAGNVTINVQGGTSNDALEIQHFEGPGELAIRAVDNSGAIVQINNSTTHNIPSILVDNNRTRAVRVSGFRLTSTAAATKISVIHNLAPVIFEWMHVTHGVASTAWTVGITTNSNQSLTTVRDSTFSNQWQTFRADGNSRMELWSNTGSGNENVFIATNHSIIQLRNTTWPTGAWFGGVHGSGDIMVLGGTTRLVPSRDNVTDIGGAALRFRTLFATTGTINTSDEREKADITPLSEDLLDFFMQLNPVSFKRKDDEHNETHFGLIAQEVEKAIGSYQSPGKIQAFGEPGKDMLCSFGGLTKHELTEIVDTGEVHEIKTPIKRMVKKAMPQPMSSSLNSADMEGLNIADYEEYEEIDDFEITTEPITEERVVGDRYGIRYSEFVPLLIKMVQMQQKRIEKLEQKLSAN